MNTVLKAPESQTANRKPQTTRPPLIDVSRGGRLQRIAEAVYLDATIGDDYREADPTLGHNVIGIALRVLVQHLSAAPGGGGDELLTVALCRREDGREVELQLGLSRTRRAGQPCLILVRAGEHVIE